LPGGGRSGRPPLEVPGGVGYGTGDLGKASALAIGIGLQNLPEGLAVALALTSEDYSRGAACTVALLTGMVEPVGRLIGVIAVTLIQPLLPWGLAFAAGAMIFVISGETIPKTHRKGFKIEGTFSLVTGFVVMMVLDTTLGETAGAARAAVPTGRCPQ
jgi:zinc transporter, ZIP family